MKEDINNSTFGSRLVSERKRLSMSQVDFAEKAGVKRASQYLYERDEGSPNHRYLEKVKEFGVDINYLFTGNRAPSNSVQLNIDLLRDIYAMVDKIAQNNDGNPLPLNNRLDFFSVLCTAYNGSHEKNIDTSILEHIVKKTA